MKKRVYQQGVSLIELMAGLVIVGILTSLALPSYRGFVISSGITTQANLIQANLMLARSEALSRGIPVSICRSTDGNNCALGSDDANNTGWGDGWIIFTDLNGNGQLDVGVDTVIRVQQKLISSKGMGAIIPTNVTTSAVADVFSFNSTGQNFGGMVRFDIKPPEANNDARYYRYVCMASGGRVRVSKTSCSAS